MGVVLETIPGKDGESRVARVKTTRGIMLRPFQRLFPLEVRDLGEDIPQEVKEAIVGTED